MELFVNNVETTLAVALDDSPDTSTMTVTSSAGAPAIAENWADGFRAIVGSEIMFVRAIDGTDWSIRRGQEGSTVAAHAENAPVVLVVTAASVVGGALTALYGIPRYARPVAGDFSWVNQGVNSAAIDRGLGQLGIVAYPSAATDVKMRVQAMAGSEFEVYALLTPILMGDGNSAGLFLRQSSDGKIITFGVKQASGALSSAIEKWTDATTYSAAYSPSSGFVVPATNAVPLALSIDCSGSTRSFRFGLGGLTMIVHATDHEDFLIPDQVGFFVNSGNAAAPVAIGLMSFEQFSWTP